MSKTRRFVQSFIEGINDMKKVRLYAYTHFNLGDDLFIKVLAERYPETSFVLAAPREYKQSFQAFDNITVHANDSIISRGFNYIFRRLHINQLLTKNCDAAVLIGGSLFIQGETWRSDLENTKSMRVKNKPFFLLGANFGPYYDEPFYLEHKKLFSTYTDICFREEFSCELFKDLPNVRMADDIVFQMEKCEQPATTNIVLSIIKPSIRKNLANYDAVYFKKMRDIAIYFIEKKYTVTLMSFCEYEGDDEAVEQIMHLIPVSYRDRITKHFYKLNMEETLDVIAGSCFVVATRFHSMILGWVYNRPVFPIVYSAKMTNVMREVGFNGAYTDFEHIHTLTPEQVFTSMKTNSLDISEQINNAAKQFDRLDDYLKSL